MEVKTFKNITDAIDTVSEIVGYSAKEAVAEATIMKTTKVSGLQGGQNNSEKEAPLKVKTNQPKKP